MVIKLEDVIKQINNSIKQLEWTKESLNQLGNCSNYVEVVQGQINTLIGIKIILNHVNKGEINKNDN